MRNAMIMTVAAVATVGNAFGGAAIVAAEQAGRRYVVIDPDAKDGYLWQWKPEDDSRIDKRYCGKFGNPSEVKPRNNGKLLVAASGSGFACVNMKTGKADFFGVVKSANLHSIDLLPDGRVALACSDGNCIALVDVKEHPFDPSKQRQNTSFKLEQAHGVVWQPYRARLWAIGATDIVELQYCPDELEFREKARFNFTEAGCGKWGHDMISDGDGNLVFTTHDTVSKLDLSAGKFTVLEKRTAVKSLSQDPKGDLYCIPREKWWTDTLIAGDKEIRRGGARFYKARYLGDYWNRPDDRLPLADPYVLPEGGVYYAYGTHSTGGITVATSKDLKSWKLGVGKSRLGLALHKDDSFADKWFWAPEVYKRADGKFVMCYTADKHICAAVADSPLGPFRQEEKKPIIAGGAIDNSLYVDDDGKVYMTYTSWEAPGYGSGLRVIEMEPDMIHVKAGAKPVFLFDAKQPWEKLVDYARVNEGPFILKHDGVYYMTYSGNGYENPRYAVGVATATSLTGPWKKCSGNPILVRHSGLFGTGHHSFFKDAKGDLKIVFHAHPDGTWHEPRHMYIASAKFVEKNGEKTIEIGDDVIEAKLEQ